MVFFVAIASGTLGSLAVFGRCALLEDEEQESKALAAERIQVVLSDTRENTP